MSGSKADDTRGDDGDLSANRFGLDLDPSLIEAAEATDAELAELSEAAGSETKGDKLADQYAELAARQMDAPLGEWWP